MNQIRTNDEVIGLTDEELRIIEEENNIIGQAFEDDTLEYIDPEELAHNIEAEGELKHLIEIENELGVKF